MNAIPPASVELPTTIEPETVSDALLTKSPPTEKLVPILGWIENLPTKGRSRIPSLDSTGAIKKNVQARVYFAIPSLSLFVMAIGFLF